MDITDNMFDIAPAPPGYQRPVEEHLLYKTPDFMNTVRLMRQKLMELSTNYTTIEKDVIRLWKIQNKTRFPNIKDFRKYEQIAQFNERNWGKVLEIEERASAILKSGKITTYTFKNIRPTMKDAEIYQILCGILSGEVKLAELNRVSTPQTTNTETSATTSNCCSKLDRLEMEKKIEELVKSLDKEKTATANLTEKIKTVSTELANWRKHAVSLEKERDNYRNKVKALLNEKNGLEQTIDSIVKRTTDERIQLEEHVANLKEELTVAKEESIHLMEESLEVNKEISKEQQVSNSEELVSDSVENVHLKRPAEKLISKEDEKVEVTISAGTLLFCDSDDFDCFSPLENSDQMNASFTSQDVAFELTTDIHDNMPATHESTPNPGKARKENAVRSKEVHDQVSIMKKNKRDRSPGSETDATEQRPRPAKRQIQTVETGFVAVGYTAARPRPPTFYLGKIVTEKDDRTLSVTFLQKIKGGRGYKWPKKPMVEDVYSHQIFAADLSPTIEADVLLFVEKPLETEFQKCLEKLAKLERNTKIEAVWEDVEAPYRKVGKVCWKDFKTLQLDMPPVHQSLMMTQLMPNTEWQVGYLNDEIIDEYIKLLEKWASKLGRKIITANTKFYQLIVQGKSWKKKVDLKKFDKLVFPSQFSPNHWSLGVVDFQHSTFSIVDPLGGKKKNARHYDNLRKFLYERGFRNEWKVEHLQHPFQHDAVSCGVYVLKIAECIMLESEARIEFSRDDIDDYRLTIAERLMEEK